MPTRFIYELLYAGILGSILYQIATDAEPRIYWFIQLLVVILYVIDWWYTRYIKIATDKYKRPQKLKRIHPVLLIIVDFLSLCSFFWASLNLKFTETVPSFVEVRNAFWIIYLVIVLYLLIHLKTNLLIEKFTLAILARVVSKLREKN